MRKLENVNAFIKKCRSENLNSNKYRQASKRLSPYSMQYLFYTILHPPFLSDKISL